MVCGPEQVGKTTLISHLCHSNKDDGKGLIREYIMNHEHEKISGNTTNIKKQIIGIKNNKLINYDLTHNWEEIAKISDKIINLYDTPGNKKYFKTILNGLRTFMIDFILILDSTFDSDSDSDSDSNSNSNYVDFLTLYAKTEKIPYIIINTKADIDMTIINKNKTNQLNISSINPENTDMDKLKEFIINIKEKEKEKINSNLIPNMFRISNIYNIPDRNKIIEGIQTNGTITKKTNTNTISYVVYPDLSFIQIQIESIFKKNIDSKQLYLKETGSISYNIVLDKLKKNNIEINKNCIIISDIKDLSQFNTFKILRLDIIFGQSYLLNCDYYLINGNLSYIIPINSIKISIENNSIEIIPQTKFYLQDNRVFLMPVNYKNTSNISNIFLCGV
jgi:GTPase